MFDRPDFNFHYDPPRKPAVVLPDGQITKLCSVCGAEFTTRARISRRCKDCQAIRNVVVAERANERLKAKRLAQKVGIR